MSIQYEDIRDDAHFSDLLVSVDPSPPVQVLQPKNSKGTTWYAAIFLVVNAALGAGLLDFPLAFNQAGGVLVSVIVQLILVTFAVAALVILAYCSDTNNSATYQDVVRSTCGKRAQQACAIAIALYCYGTCVTFVIIIGDQFDRALDSMYGSDFCHKWYLTRQFTTALSFLILVLPLCFAKKMDFLKYSSIFGVISILYVVFLIIYQYYKGNYEPVPAKTSPDSWTDVFLVIPVICFGYQCHVSAIPIYSCLDNRSIKSFLRTIVVAVTLCIFTYTAAGTYGLLTFGDKVSSDILYTYNPSDPIVLVGIIALAVKTFTTYPILLFCGRAAVDDLYTQVRGLHPEIAAQTESLRRRVIVVLWFVTSVGLALILTNIGVVIQVLGSLAAVFIFVFPGLCLLFVTLHRDPDIQETKNQIRIIVAVTFVAIGFFLFGLVLTQSISMDVRGGKTETVVLCVRTFASRNMDFTPKKHHMNRLFSQGV